jgi:hypothetical protein
MLDFNSHDVSDFVTGLLDRGMEAVDADTPGRSYLGASSLGEACARRLQFQYFGTPKDEGQHTPGRTLRIFQRGHDFEDLMVRWLRIAGFDLKTRKPDGEQFGFSTAGGRLQGHIDGVIVAGPEGLAYPALWENKAVGAKTFRELQSKRLALSRPVYAAQVAIYQAYLGLHEQPALFTAVNADTMEVYAERIAFDAALAQRSSDRAVQILRACDAQELLPRIALESSHYECRMCPWAWRCWSFPK